MGCILAPSDHRKRGQASNPDAELTTFIPEN